MKIKETISVTTLRPIKVFSLQIQSKPPHHLLQRVGVDDQQINNTLSDFTRFSRHEKSEINFTKTHFYLVLRLFQKDSDPFCYR